MGGDDDLAVGDINELGFVLFWFIAPFSLNFRMDYALRHHWTRLLEQ